MKTSVRWMGKVLDVRSPELFVQITASNDRNKIEVSCVETRCLNSSWEMSCGEMRHMSALADEANRNMCVLLCMFGVLYGEVISEIFTGDTKVNGHYAIL